MTKTKIIIAGIGGVGGYFGGLLAKHYHDSKNVEIFFLARGQHLEEIKKNGLKVIKGDVEFIAKPTLATNNSSEIGIADVIIIATKIFDLETIIQQLQPCINQDTIILSLLNGVDSKQRIENILPGNLVLDGCVYIVSRLKQPGIIENSGNVQSLYFGKDDFVNERLSFLEEIFKQANIEATYSKNISSIIWEKFIFLSPTATITAAYDTCIGKILSDKDSLATITLLITEISELAKAKKITLSENITEKTLIKLKSLPFETTTSMHTDFINKKMKTELGSLTEFVIKESEKFNIPTPTYLRLYETLIN